MESLELVKLMRKINTHILPLTSKKNIIALHIFYLVYQGEVTVQSFLRRHNCNKKILEEKLDHRHLADLLCHTDFYEVLYLLACSSLHKVDLTKLEFSNIIGFEIFDLQELVNDLFDKLVNNEEIDFYISNTIALKWYLKNTSQQHKYFKNLLKKGITLPGCIFQNQWDGDFLQGKLIKFYIEQ
ncbi:unnamed protein product [Rhizophagus irregularis]|nr:unnamed protein product [Rhizophagus irregularis]